MKKHVHTTWYRLADGTQADPNDVAPDAKGVLRHKNGVHVALHEDGTPMSIGVAAEAPASAAAPVADEPAEAGATPAPKTAREMRPAKKPATTKGPEPGYETRET